MGMKRYRFNEQQKAEYNRRVSTYSNGGYYLKDARPMARRDVENMIYLAEVEATHKPKIERR